eukprot:1327943-Amorphochlora_amoeboformis.AAC.1
MIKLDTRERRVRANLGGQGPSEACDNEAVEHKVAEVFFALDGLHWQLGAHDQLHGGNHLVAEDRWLGRVVDSVLG